MPNKNCLELHIKQDVDRNLAEGLSTRIRAAIRNKITAIDIRWDGTYTITSAEFLGFLLTTGKHLDTLGGQLKLYPPKGKIHSLLQIANLSGYIQQPEENTGNTNATQNEIKEQVSN